SHGRLREWRRTSTTRATSATSPMPDTSERSIQRDQRRRRRGSSLEPAGRRERRKRITTHLGPTATASERSARSAWTRLAPTTPSMWARVPPRQRVGGIHATDMAIGPPRLALLGAAAVGVGQGNERPQVRASSVVQRQGG